MKPRSKAITALRVTRINDKPVHDMTDAELRAEWAKWTVTGDGWTDAAIADANARRAACERAMVERGMTVPVQTTNRGPAADMTRAANSEMIGRIKIGMGVALAFAMGAETRGLSVFPSIAFSQEDDGRHIADITSVPGCMAYGSTQEEALRNVLALWHEVTAAPQTEGDA